MKKEILFSNIGERVLAVYEIAWDKSKPDYFSIISDWDYDNIYMPLKSILFSINNNSDNDSIAKDMIKTIIKDIFGAFGNNPFTQVCLYSFIDYLKERGYVATIIYGDEKPSDINYDETNPETAFLAGWFTDEKLQEKYEKQWRNQ